MSVARNFRVTVNLSSYFHDHRNRARIFINDDIQTIRDLEVRIEKIFNIKNFHLTSQNEFLPPLEDARILQKDDIVWVIQNEQNYEKIFAPDTSTKKSSKKLNAISNKRSASLTNEYIEEELRSPKKKKKKKSNLEKTEDSASLIDEFVEEDLQSPKKGEKKDDLEKNKKSVSLANEYTEELQSLKKKKRKKDNLEIDKNNLLNNEPKMKKKKKTSGRVNYEEETSNMETKYDSPAEKKIKKKKKAADYSSDNSASTTQEEGLNPPKDNFMKINTLLPVLHSHINTYNKKMSANSSKTTTSLVASEITSSIAAKRKELGIEKKERYICKGNLSLYKKYVPVPTITDQYLKKKKVNIVKIEYLNGKPETVEQLERSNSNTENDNTGSDTLSQSSENQNTAIIEDPNKPDSEEIIKQNKGLSSDVSTDFAEFLSTPKTTDEVKSAVDSDNFDDDSKEAANITETENITSNSNTNSNQNASDHNINQNINTLPNSNGILSTYNICSTFSQSQEGAVDSDLESTFSTGDENCSGMTTLQLSRNNDSSTNFSSPAKEVLKVNKFKSFTTNSNADLTNLNSNSNQESMSPKIKELDKPLSNSAENTKIVLRKLNSPHQQKYFIFKPLASKESELKNSVDSPKTLTIANKENSVSNFTSTKDSGVVVQSTYISNNYVPESSDLLNEIQEPSRNIGVTLSSAKSSDKAINEINTKVSRSVSNEDLNVRANRKISETTTDILNKNLLSRFTSGSNDCGTSMENSKNLHDSYRDSITSEMDLTNHISGIRPGTSKFVRLKQASGVGQLLSTLRASDSVVSVESLDSDCSEFVTKRRRKRTRKRAKKNRKTNSDTSLNDSSLMITEAYVQKPLNVKACPSIHIKFEEDEEGEEEVSDLSKDRNTEAENESFVENITIKSDLEECKLEKFHIEDDVILKSSPSMENMLPRISDIIAFKILRITENYTPEITSYITGKVVEFDTETKQVTYEILSGLAQCEELKDNVSLEEGESSKTGSNRREFAWVDLIDPRLIYP